MSQMMKRLLCLAMLLMLAALPALSESVSARVSANARFYCAPSAKSDSVRIAEGTRVTVTAATESWAKVKYKGVTGYIPVKALAAATEKRVAAYVREDAYAYASASTASAKKAVPVNTKVYVTGTSGEFCRVQNASGTLNCYILKDSLSASRVTATGAKAWKSKVIKINWFDGGSAVLKTGSYGYIYDIDTGIIVHIKRMGGTNHADCEPASKSDTAKLLKIAGGTFSWDSHAVILYAGGKFVACGINTKPHGDQTIANNGYNGQFCLHMTGSKTHSSDEVNVDHQSSIERAYNWAH